MDIAKMRILIYGAGVIGSLYASLFSEAGIDTTVYARGRRLESLRQNGLQYKKDGKIQTANVRVQMLGYWMRWQTMTSTTLSSCLCGKISFTKC